MGKKSPLWTDERIAKLTSLWAAGDSAGLIAQKMGDVSRSAVIGKIKRLGLTRNQSLPKFRVTDSAPRPVRPKPVPVVIVPRLLPPTGAAGTMLTGNVCKFITGDVLAPDWAMCGRPGHPWCPDHRALVFQKEKTARPENDQVGAVANRSFAKMGLG